MTKTIAMTHDNRTELKNAINNPDFIKSARIELHSRFYSMSNPGQGILFTITTNNKGQRVIKRNHKTIADSSTLGNNMIARMDINNAISDFIDAYIKQTKQKVYGK